MLSDEAELNCFTKEKENFPNNSECSEQSNLSFKVNSGPKTNFRVEGIDEEKKSHNRSFQPKWITNDFAWLAYSAIEDSVYCKPCWLFFYEGVGKGGHQNPGKLVSVGFRDWKKAKESFKKHMEKEYHKVCVLQATSFLKISAGKQLDTVFQLDVNAPKR
ncbi:hypothetical protein TNCT_273041 [Trichonephila clavata]|uniref:TTF-type domain-containing protein n=1 Tax=Trichonephila clavata TaxID=2740835 RepID=A0A8X6FCD0_TRICU|nr:hypothetical protein TNCT_273041 [Trichonephila clavata]